MNVNVRGTIDLIRQVLPHMARTAPTAPDNERGVIIMVASSAAFDGQPGQVAYAASKGAIRSLTLPLTRDLARHGIRVVTIAPSLFDSRMTAMMSDKVRASLTRVMEFPGTFCPLFTFLILPSSLMIVRNFVLPITSPPPQLPFVAIMPGERKLEFPRPTIQLRRRLRSSRTRNWMYLLDGHCLSFFLFPSSLLCVLCLLTSKLSLLGKVVSSLQYAALGFSDHKSLTFPTYLC
jgi:hypothetical protein